jgi:hypothetical protein
MEFAVVVEGNGGINDKSIWEGQISARVADVTEVLLSLTTVKNVMVSMNDDSCHRTGEVPVGRGKGRTIKWVSKSRGREQLSVEWKLGIRDLDAKTGLLTGLLTGIQGWKCPVALSQTCYGSKSLKVILMDSNFGGHPVLNPLVTL